MQLFSFLFLIFFVFKHIGVRAQLKNDSLKQVISFLEKKHQISFNYTEENSNYKVYFEPETELSQTLLSLEKQTRATF